MCGGADAGPHDAGHKGTILGLFRRGDGEKAARVDDRHFRSDRRPGAAAGDLRLTGRTPCRFHGKTAAGDARPSLLIALYTDRLDGSAVSKCRSNSLSDAL